MRLLVKRLGLEKAKSLGYSVEIYFVYVDSVQLAKERIRSRVANGGHGIPDETTGEAYLLPNDGSGQNLKTAFSLKTFYDELGRLNAKSVTVFLDACFSGAQRGEGMLMAARGVAIAPREETPQQGNTIVFSAASGKETAWPYNEKGHGLFTYFLLKKLRESNGEATLGELDSYIQKYVKRSIMDLGYDAKMQTPKATASPALANSWRTMKLK